MIAAITGYVLRGGKPGYDRLLLLARNRRADTRALLERAGICAAMRCIDIGCGGGEVTMAIAAMVAPGRHGHGHGHRPGQAGPSPAGGGGAGAGQR